MTLCEKCVFVCILSFHDNGNWYDELENVQNWTVEHKMRRTRGNSMCRNLICSFNLNLTVDVIFDTQDGERLFCINHLRSFHLLIEDNRFVEKDYLLTKIRVKLISCEFNQPNAKI